MNTSEERVRELIAAQAGEWFMAHRAGPLEAGERRAFYAWLAASPAHVEEYLGVALISRQLPAAADDPNMPLESLLDRVREENVTAFEGVAPSPLAGDRKHRMPVWGWAAVPAALAVIGTALLWWSGLQTKAEHYATRHGEQITQRLADSSVIRLDTDSAVTVRYDRTQRLVEVERGRAFFEVSHDSGRPFRVLAGYAEARDVGTKFDVYRQSDSTVVTVVEGQVVVGLAPGQPGAAAAAGRTVPVRAGERLQVSQGSLPATATPADTRRSTAWLRREIVFEQEPLAIVAAEFNRYGATPIVIETPDLRSLQISGVFYADDPETFVAFLRSLDGVKVEVTRTSIRVSRM